MVAAADQVSPEKKAYRGSQVVTVFPQVGDWLGLRCEGVGALGAPAQLCDYLGHTGSVHPGP